MNGDAQLTNAILATANVLLQEAGRLFKPHGLTAVQFNVLNLLADAPDGLRPSDLTAALVVDASSTTYVLDQMEKRGWLRRREDAADRRAYRIGLTTGGRELHGRVAPLYRAALRRTVGGLDRSGIEAITAALRGIQTAARGAVETVAADSPRAKPARRRVKT